MYRGTRAPSSISTGLCYHAPRAMSWRGRETTRRGNAAKATVFIGRMFCYGLRSGSSGAEVGVAPNPRASSARGVHGVIENAFWREGRRETAGAPERGMWLARSAARGAGFSMQWLSDLPFGDNRVVQIGFLAACGIAALVALAIVYRLVFAHRLRVPGGRTRQPRLGLVDAFSLDGQRQLVLVRRDNVEHLVMIGGPNDVLLESQINRALAAPRENGLAASGRRRPRGGAPTSRRSRPLPPLRRRLRRPQSRMRRRRRRRSRPNRRPFRFAPS